LRYDGAREDWRRLTNTFWREKNLYLADYTERRMRHGRRNIATPEKTKEHPISCSIIVILKESCTPTLHDICAMAECTTAAIAGGELDALHGFCAFFTFSFLVDSFIGRP